MFLNFQRLHDLPRLEVADSYIPNLAVLNQGFHRSKLLFKQAHILDPVEDININMIGIESGQRPLDFAHDVIARSSLIVRTIPYRAKHL